MFSPLILFFFIKLKPFYLQHQLHSQSIIRPSQLHPQSTIPPSTQTPSNQL